MPDVVSRGGRSQLERFGRASWSLIGVIILALLIAAGLGALSGIVIPLVVAAIIAVVMEPVVDLFIRLRVPRTLAAVFGLILSLLVAGCIVAIVILGFLQQLPDITTQLASGWTSVLEFGRSLDIESVWLERVQRTAEDYAPQMGFGALSLITSTVYGTVSFAIGAFFAFFFLFFILRDGHAFAEWIASITGRDRELAHRVDGEVRRCLRGYFRGVAVTAIITVPIFVIPLLLLGIPLVIPITIIYLLLSFVPFVGAWITGAFAILIAFGSGGAPAALIVALSLLVSNGTVQSAVSSWALGSSLRMHPIAALVSTLIGGSVAGILGMVLGAPLLAAVRGSTAILRSHRSPPAADHDNPD